MFSMANLLLQHQDLLSLLLLLTSKSTIYSFDMAKQVHFPSDPTCIQPWAIYFLTPFKCGIFGVACEAIPRQIFYLIDEGMSIGKGANSIISYLHHFSQPHGLGEKTAHLHADNCMGQNKNNYVLHYFVVDAGWLITTQSLNHPLGSQYQICARLVL